MFKIKIKMLETRNEAGEVFASGSFYDISEGQALTWIGCKIAESAEPELIEKRKEAK